MKKLIESIFSLENVSNLTENSKILEFTELLSNLTEEEMKEFANEFEKAIRRIPKDRINSKREVFEYICTEVKLKKDRESIEKCVINSNISSSNLLQSKSISHLNTNITINSPEKQSNGTSNGGTRWTILREERRKILELMEKAREDQKRRKKKDWCRQDGVNEFEELWNNFDDKNEKLSESDLELMRINEGIPVIPPIEIKKVRIETPDYGIVDFDCIENLLISLTSSKSSMSSSAKFILNTADDIYRSDLMFFTDLRGFDQPYFTYYNQDDDLFALKYYVFEDDDLGRFSRNRPFKDRHRKFYRERAYRHRYISRKPYGLFFPNETISKRLRDEIEFLDKNCDEFHFWISRAISKKGTIFITGKPLLKSFALLLVLSRTIEMTTFEISNSIWSHLKYGIGWTLKEIINKSYGTPCYLTTERDSKLSIEAEKMSIKFV